MASELNHIEFSTQAYAKMIMHAMKYAHNNCGGFLLGPRDNGQDSKDKEDVDQKQSIKIIDAIPVGHASLGLAPNVEVAFNSVTMYALQQDLIICGYYHTDKHQESNSPDLFSQKITEKLCENYPNAVLCFLKFASLSDDSDSFLVPYQFVDGKWRKKPNDTFSIECDKKKIFDKVFLSKEKLYRNMVDFDDHLNDISLDWTNAKISQKIDHIISNVC